MPGVDTEEATPVPSHSTVFTLGLKDGDKAISAATPPRRLLPQPKTLTSGCPLSPEAVTVGVTPIASGLACA